MVRLSRTVCHDNAGSVSPLVAWLKAEKLPPNTVKITAQGAQDCLKLSGNFSRKRGEGNHPGFPGPLASVTGNRDDQTSRRKEAPFEGVIVHYVHE